MMSSLVKHTRNFFGYLIIILFSLNVLSITGTSFLEFLFFKKSDSKAQLPNYHETDWSEAHFDELKLMRLSFRAYYGWQHHELVAETINIDDDGLRRSYRHAGGANAKTVAFFGGSTMFGEGARDDETIASLFVKLSKGYRALNYGTRGFVAHQSLNRLLKEYYGGLRPDVVVSYDGFNEVAIMCRTNTSPYSHSAEPEIRERLETDYFDPGKFSSLFMPMKGFISMIYRIVNYKFSLVYKCSEDDIVSETIARNLLNDWVLIKQLTESYGGIFVAVLQPVASLSETKRDHLTLGENLQRQIPAVYNKIGELLQRPEFSTLSGNVHDLTDVLNVDEYIYIDEAHVSPNGNRYIAERLVAILQDRGG